MTTFMQIPFTIQGALVIDYYQCRTTSGQIIPIYIFGEIHNDPGNSVTFLHELMKRTTCPVDVILEINFLGDKISNFKYYSNYVLLQKEYDICLHNDTIIDQTQFAVNTDTEFFQKCIQPFQGRLKFWSVDKRIEVRLIRSMEIFFVLTETSQHLVELRNRFFQSVFLCIHNEEGHKDELKKNLYTLMTCFETNAKNIDRFEADLKAIDTDQKKNEIIDQFVDKILAKLFRKSRIIPQDILQEWCQISQKETFSTSMFSVVMDLFLIVKMFNIIEKNQNGIILVFIGDSHRRRIFNLLQSNKYKRKSSESTIPFIEFKEQYERTSVDMKDDGTFLAFTNVNFQVPSTCSQSTFRMQKYQEAIQMSSPRHEHRDDQNHVFLSLVILSLVAIPFEMTVCLFFFLLHFQHQKNHESRDVHDVHDNVFQYILMMLFSFFIFLYSCGWMMLQMTIICSTTTNTKSLYWIGDFIFMVIIAMLGVYIASWNRNKRMNHEISVKKTTIHIRVIYSTILLIFTCLCIVVSYKTKRYRLN